MRSIGQVTGGSGSTPNEFDFAGQQSDDSTGMQYLRARYYDPATGVFISRDPLASGPGWLGNSHGYASANPAMRTDPTGLYDNPPSSCDLSPDGWDCLSSQNTGPVAPGIVPDSWSVIADIFDALSALPSSSAVDYMLDALAFHIISGVFLLHRWAHSAVKDCVANEYCRRAGDTVFDISTVLAGDISVYLGGLRHGFGPALKALGIFGNTAGIVWWAYARWADSPDNGRLQRAVRRLEQRGTP